MPGPHLWRLSLVTAASFGAAGGTAPVDRPVAVDAWTSLPYVPRSSLLGVIVDRRGSRFGTADQDAGGGFRQGTASPVVVGDGHLLCFPVMLRDGSVAAVIPMTTLHQLADIGWSVAVDGLDRAPGAYSGDVPEGLLPSVAGELCWSHARVDRRALETLAGRALGQLIVARAVAAARLWRAAAEYRAQTALDDTKRVRSGSLRRIELVPEGTVFLSLVTNTATDTPLGDLRLLQAGSWEASGLGFIAIEEVGPLPSAAATPQTTSALGDMARDEASIMEAIFRGLRDVPPAEASKLRSAIMEFGPRWLGEGLPAALAFIVAKAGVDRPLADVSAEHRAYQRLLSLLLDSAGAPDDLRAAATGVATAERPPVDLMPRWLWARRYAEVLLDRPAGST